MCFGLKQSRIKKWWIAKEDSRLAFANILADKTLKGNFVVIGYIDDKKLVVSPMKVVKIITKGVITSDKTFYPFNEAHYLYLQFLVKANNIDAVIARNWKCTDSTKKDRIIADIIDNGVEKKDVEFDFIQDEEQPYILSGYSKELSTNVIISNFDRRNEFISIMLEFDIFMSSIYLVEEYERILKEVRDIFAKNIKKRYIPVVGFGD